MAIVKSKHASNFTVIPNEIINHGLSLEALGLLTHLLSLPPDWVIYKSSLHNKFNIGEKRLDAIFKQLQCAGYIISVKVQNPLKQFEWNHIVYDIPFNGEPPPLEGGVDSHTPIGHGVAEPSMAKEGLLSTHIQSTNNTKERSKKETDLSFVSEEFKPLMEKWLIYKKEKGQGYKGKNPISICYQRLLRMSNNSAAAAAEILETAMANNWSGFFPLKHQAFEKKDQHKRTNSFFNPAQHRHGS